MRWLVGLVALAMAMVSTLTACSGDDDDAGGGESPGTTAATAAPLSTQARQATVVVPPYPYWDNDVIAIDQDLLDEFASEHVQALGDGAASSEAFVFGWMPIHVFDDILAADGVDDRTSAWLGLLHLSGYFGGVWLRGAIDRAQPGTSMIADIRTAPTQGDFDETVADARAALDAANGTGDEALAYAAASLFPTPGETPGFTGDGLAQGFGYNQGYLLEILANPPEGLETPQNFVVTCDGVLACTYALPRLNALAGLAETTAMLANPTSPEQADLSRRIATEQSAYVPQGRAVWSGGLSVQGFTQEEYETLLDVSSSFLQTLQATALTAAAAVAGGDADAARRAAIANAAMTVWLRGYSAGLLEGRSPAVVPSISES